MEHLNKLYEQNLENIANEIQESEILQQYLEEEDEAIYQSLVEAFEPKIAEVYDEVALNAPLQLLALEVLLRHEGFEGLFLPRLLGYSVLRGEVDEYYKFVLQQESFGAALQVICDSPNFESIRKRIGQTIQIGFALSSDIWITNFTEKLENKRIRFFLQTQKLDKYRDPESRRVGLYNYRKQFRNQNYYTCTFPDSPAELTINFHSLRSFLEFRIMLNQENQSFLGKMVDFVSDKKYFGSKEHLILTSLIINFFELSKAESEKMALVFNTIRKETPDFATKYFEFQTEILRSDLPFKPSCDKQVANLLDKKIQDDVSKYYALIGDMASKGFVHGDIVEQIRTLYGQNEGLSPINECIRLAIFKQFKQVIVHLQPEDFKEFIENITKLFPVYMDIFSNQQFVQDLEDVSTQFIKDCIVYFTDKRGKDYQAIKHFVAKEFVEWGFMKDKEVVETFKSKRKKKDE